LKPDAPSEAPVRQLQLPTGTVAYTDEGEGLPIVLVHGLPGSGRDFRWLAPCLTPQFRVIRIDQPGFGDSPLATMPYVNMRWRVDHLAQVLDALNLAKVAVLGHSMGGPVATMLAARHPDRVHALALVSSVGLRPHAGFRSLPGKKLISAALRFPPLRYYMLPRLRESMLSAGFRGHSDIALLQTMHLVAAHSFSLHNQALSRIAVPTMVAWCEDDPLVESAISEELYWHCAGGPRIAFPDGGHNPQKHKAVELSESLTAWLM
jgi:pimeloyl-ACP methyl ester carboxylesterase